MARIVKVTLEDSTARVFDQVCAEVNAQPSDPLTADQVASDLLNHVLEDYARENGVGEPRH